MGVVNCTCITKQTLVKGQLTLFGEQASSDIDNLGKS